MLSESNLIPLQLRRKQITVNYAIKILQSPKNQAYQLINQTDRDINVNKPNCPISFKKRSWGYLKSYNLSPLDFHPPQENKKRFWKQSEASCAKKKIGKVNYDFNQFIDKHPESRHIYTTTFTNLRYIGAAARLSNEESILIKLPQWHGTQSVLQTLILHTIENIDPKIDTIIHI